jgi:tRNA ligase
VRLLALDWSSAVASLPSSTTHRICSDRIVRRGDSHQTLPADASEARSHEEVVWMFINKIEELGEEEVDDHIEMQLEENGKDALKRAVDGVVKVLGLPPPDEKQIEEALAIAATHSPKVNKKAQKSSKKKKGPKTPRYYALLPEIDLKTVVSGALSAAVHQEGQKFWAHLEENNMVTPTPHITIVHTKELPHRKELWQRCADIQRLAVPPQFAFKLGTLVWNERVMALTVDDMELDEPGESGPEQEVAEFVSTLTHDAGFRLHITVGTRDASVSAFEAKVLTEDWRSGKEMEGVYSLGVGGLVGKGRLKGLIQ